VTRRPTHSSRPGVQALVRCRARPGTGHSHRGRRAVRLLVRPACRRGWGPVAVIPRRQGVARGLVDPVSSARLPHMRDLAASRPPGQARDPRRDSDACGQSPTAPIPVSTGAVGGGGANYGGAGHRVHQASSAHLHPGRRRASSARRGSRCAAAGAAVPPTRSSHAPGRFCRPNPLRQTLPPPWDPPATPTRPTHPRC
jgi:hypothetical protein